MTRTSGTSTSLIVARVSTTSGNHPWYDSPDGFSSLFVTVTEVGDDGTGGGVGGQGSPATEGGSGGAPQPSESQTEPQGRPPPPQNIKIVPGDRQLTVTWEVGPRDGVENSEIRHALRWRQNPGPGKWKNTHPPHVLPKDGHSFKGGITSFVIKGLKNDVAADVQIRAFTGGNDYDHAVTTSNWIAFKGTETTPFKPNNPPTVASAIADVGPLTVGNDATIDLSGVFDDADGDLLTLDSRSSDDNVAIGFVQYAPDAELWILALSRGTTEITVTANDERGGTVSDTFTVTVKEAPTVAKPIADVSSLKTGKSKKISLSGVFADADGDALKLSAASSDTDVVSVSSQVDPDTASATSITVLAVSSGTATITVTAQDTDDNRVIDTFDVTVPAAQQQVQPQAAQPQQQQQQTVELPGPVVSLQVTASKAKSVKVSWNAPETGGAPNGYIVHLKPEDGEKGSGKTKRPKAKKTQVHIQQTRARSHLQHLGTSPKPNRQRRTRLHHHHPPLNHHHRPLSPSERGHGAQETDTRTQGYARDGRAAGFPPLRGGNVRRTKGARSGRAAHRHSGFRLSAGMTCDSPL